MALGLGGSVLFRTWSYQKAPLNYFNWFIGGLQRAKAKGLDVSYAKMELDGKLIGALNKLLPKGANLYAFYPFLELKQFQIWGWLRKDIQLSTSLPAQFLLLYSRPSWMREWEQEIDRQNLKPLWQKTHAGVPLLRLYLFGPDGFPPKEVP